MTDFYFLFLGFLSNNNKKCFFSCICFSIDVENSFSFCFSSMTSSLSSMNGSCLQQREAASSYPYMFHDPLHSLSSTYNHSRAAAVSAACNSAVAHQNSVNTHSSYGSVGSSSGGPSGTGTQDFLTS